MSNTTKEPLYSLENIFEKMSFGAAALLLPLVRRTSLTPNSVTLISGLFGVVAAFLMCAPNSVNLFFAGVFIAAFSILDSLDGLLAKSTGRCSAFGAWLDIFFDKLNDILLISAMAYGSFVLTDEPLYLVCGMLLVGVVFYIQFIIVLDKYYFHKDRASNEDVLSKKGGETISGLRNGVFKILMFYRKQVSLNHNLLLFLIMLGCLLNQLVLFLMIISFLAIVSLVFLVMVNFVKLYPRSK